MARRPCPIVITCDGVGPQPEPDWPVTNYSAEAPDPLIFAAIVYPHIGMEPPGCFYTDTCPQFPALDCFGVLYTADSQEQADALAAAASINCPVWPPSSEGSIYSNDAKTATLYCPNGTSFTYTVEAGTMVSGLLDDVIGPAWKETADQWAQAYALQKAAELMDCIDASRTNGGGSSSALTDNPGWACIGEELLPEENTYTVSNPGGREFVFSISGSIPPGIEFKQISPIACTLSGTLTTAGIFTYTIKAISTTLPTVTLEVEDTLYVVEIVNDSPLPDAEICAEYSVQLTAIGVKEPVTFTYTPLTFPDWISLSPSGLITGTPQSTDANSDISFTATVTDANEAECSKEFTLHVGVCPTMDILPHVLATGIVGTPYGQNIAVVGGTPPYTIGWTGGGVVPPGLGVDDILDAVIGTPESLGHYEFGIRAVDACGCSTEITVEIDIGTIGNAAYTSTCPTGGASYTVPANTYVNAGVGAGMDQATLDAFASVQAVNQLGASGACPDICSLNVGGISGDSWQLVTVTCPVHFFLMRDNGNPWTPPADQATLLPGVPFDYWDVYFLATTFRPFGTVHFCKTASLATEVFKIHYAI